MVRGEFRRIDYEEFVKPGQTVRYFLRAKEFIQYRFTGRNARIQSENQEEGLIRGKGYFKCLVHYGINEIDLDEHEFDYEMEFKDTKAFLRIKNIYSFKTDPNDNTLAFGPQTEKDAKNTLKLCFKPMAEEYFSFVK